MQYFINNKEIRINDKLVHEHAQVIMMPLTAKLLLNYICIQENIDEGDFDTISNDRLGTVADEAIRSQTQFYDHKDGGMYFDINGQTIFITDDIIHDHLFKTGNPLTSKRISEYAIKQCQSPDTCSSSDIIMAIKKVIESAK